jgi:hypothetical protein
MNNPDSSEAPHYGPAAGSSGIDLILGSRGAAFRRCAFLDFYGLGQRKANNAVDAKKWEFLSNARAHLHPSFPIPVCVGRLFSHAYRYQPPRRLPDQRVGVCSGCPIVSAHSVTAPPLQPCTALSRPKFSPPSFPNPNPVTFAWPLPRRQSDSIVQPQCRRTGANVTFNGTNLTEPSRSLESRADSGNKHRCGFAHYGYRDAEYFRRDSAGDQSLGLTTPVEQQHAAVHGPGQPRRSPAHAGLDYHPTSGLGAEPTSPPPLSPGEPPPAQATAAGSEPSNGAGAFTVTGRYRASEQSAREQTAHCRALCSQPPDP